MLEQSNSKKIRKNLPLLEILPLKARGGEPIYYHGAHKLWIIAGGPQIAIDFIPEFYLHLAVRDRSSYDILVPAYH